MNATELTGKLIEFNGGTFKVTRVNEQRTFTGISLQRTTEPMIEVDGELIGNEIRLVTWIVKKPFKVI